SAMRSKQREIDDALKKRGSLDPLMSASLKKIEAGYDKLRDDINTLWRKDARTRSVIHGGDPRAAAIEFKALKQFRAWMGVDDPTHPRVVDGHKAYQQAYGSWLRKGDEKMTDFERKALSVGEAPSGGFWVAPAQADFILQRVFETSVIRPFARTMTISTDSVKVPLDRQRTTGRWVGETSSRTPTTTAQFGEMMIGVHELMSQPAITQNMIDDSSIDIEGWAQEKIVQDFALSQNTAFVNGNGVWQPRGFLTYPVATQSDQAGRAFGTIETIQTGVSGAFKTATATVSPADDLIALLYAFKAPYRVGLRFGSTRTTLGLVRKFKDQMGNYIAGPRLDKD